MSLFLLFSIFEYKSSASTRHLLWLVTHWGGRQAVNQTSLTATRFKCHCLRASQQHQKTLDSTKANLPLKQQHIFEYYRKSTMTFPLIHPFLGNCGSVCEVGYQMIIEGLAVHIRAPTVNILKCLKARQRTLNYSQWSWQAAPCMAAATDWFMSGSEKVL